MAERWTEFFNQGAKDVEVSIHLKDGHSITCDGELKVYHPEKKKEGLIIYIPSAGMAQAIYKKL